MRLIYGSGEIVAFLEARLEQARRGEFEIVAFVGLETAGDIGTGLAFNHGIDHPFSRTLGGVAALQHDILTGKLNFDG